MPQEVFEFDAAISFAAEDRSTAKELSRRLTAKNIKVYLDEYTSSEPWGRSVLDHLVNLYARKARYCVLLISRHYPLGAWTDKERDELQERALRDAHKYILPLRLDDTDVPGLTEEQTLESIADLLEEKLRDSKKRMVPPPQSHDLRSGNVPSERRDGE